MCLIARRAFLSPRSFRSDPDHRLQDRVRCDRRAVGSVNLRPPAWAVPAAGASRPRLSVFPNGLRPRPRVDPCRLFAIFPNVRNGRAGEFFGVGVIHSTVNGSPPHPAAEEELTFTCASSATFSVLPRPIHASVRSLRAPAPRPCCHSGSARLPSPRNAGSAKRCRDRSP